MIPDVAAAKRYLSRLDPECDVFTFQTFGDRKRSANLTTIVNGDPSNGVLGKLARLNEAGAGVFVTVNRTDGKGRQAHNVTEVRALFVDLDGAPLPPVLNAAVQPHMVVQSSEGRYHAYWLVDDCPLDAFERVQRALAARFGGDPSVHDLPRVLRVPGFVHQKADPFVSQILEGIGFEGPPYALAEVVGGLALELVPRAVQQAVPAGNAIPKGARHDRLFALGRSMARRGTSQAGVRAALVAENARCDPPLPDDDIEYLVRRAHEAKNANTWNDKPARPKADQESDALPKPATALELLERDMPIISKLCDPYISEGLHIMAARPKLGKSTMARQKAAAIACGGEFLGRPVTKGVAAMLSLEEGDRLTREKFRKAGFTEEALANILLYFSWRRGADGVLDLTRFLDQYPAVKYVCIDSLTKFRAVPDARTNAFSADYEAVSALHAVAKSRPGLTIDLIHHTRKMSSDDPLDDISGTYGISAAVDAYTILRHHEDGATMHCGGRLWDSESSKFQLRRANQRWELVGEFAGLSPIQVETLDLLRAAGNGLSPTQIAQTFAIGRQAAYDRLHSLVRHGVAHSRNGSYFAN